MADLERIRGDLAAFADAAGCPLERWQADALALEARTSAIVAPRQSGKSRSLAVLALWWAYRRTGQRVLIVSAGEEAARRLLGEVRRVATGSPLLRSSVVDEAAGLVTLSNGSEVRSVPASERQVRGWSVDLLLVDEAAMVPDDLLLGAALPTTAARPEARVVLASSAYTADGAFFDAVRRGEAGSEHLRAFRWALADCHWISPSTIEAARESMSETRFRAEYEGVFSSGADALFSRAALERATADYLPSALGELRGPARLLGGVDWGATVDRSALVALGRLPIDGGRVFGVACAQRWPAGAPLDGVIGEIAGCSAHFDTLAMETNGLGLPCVQDLSRRLERRSPESGGAGLAPRFALIDEHPDYDAVARFRRHEAAHAASVEGRRAFRTRRLAVHTTAELKAATYSTLRLLLDQGRLVLPASATELLRELLMLRVDLTPGGGERIEASSGHDDLADALMLAACPTRGHDRRWTSLLAYYAEATAPVPATALAPGVLDGLATVATGGGLELPREPVWQSIRGHEVTAPPGVDLAPRERPHPGATAIREALAESFRPDPHTTEVHP